MQRNGFVPNFARCVGLMVLIWAIPCQAATFNIPADFATVSAAIAAPGVSNGDILQLNANITDSPAITKSVSVIGTLAGPLAKIDGEVRIQASNVSIQSVEIGGAGSGLVFDTVGGSLNLSGSAINGNSSNGVLITSGTVTLDALGSTFNSNAVNGFLIDPPAPATGIEIYLTTCNVENNVNRNFDWNGPNPGGGVVELVSCNFVAHAGMSRNLEIDNVTNVDMLIDSCNMNGTGNTVGFGINVNGRNVNWTIVNTLVTGFLENQVRSNDNAVPHTSSILVDNCQFTGFTTRGMQIRKHVGPCTIQNCGFSGGLLDSALRIQECDNQSIDLIGLQVANADEGIRFRDCPGAILSVTDCLVEQCDDGIQLFNDTNPSNPFELNVVDSTIRDNNVGVRLNDDVDMANVSVSNCEFTGNKDMLWLDDTGGQIFNNSVVVDGCVIYDANETSGPSHLIHCSNSATNVSVTVTHTTAYNFGDRIVNINVPAGDVDVTLAYNVFADWNVVGLTNNGVGTVTETYNAFVDPNILTETVVGAGTGTVVRVSGSSDTDDLDAVFCTLEPAIYTSFLHIKPTGPAFQIDGVNNAGARSVCPVPASAVQDWTLYN